MKALFAMILDFLYAPFVRAHIREILLSRPIFPGQIWDLPDLGQVKITSVNKSIVCYSIEDDSYECSRKDFIIHASISKNKSCCQIVEFNNHREKE